MKFDIDYGDGLLFFGEAEAEAAAGGCRSSCRTGQSTHSWWYENTHCTETRWWSTDSFLSCSYFSSIIMDLIMPPVLLWYRSRPASMSWPPRRCSACVGRNTDKVCWESGCKALPWKQAKRWVFRICYKFSINFPHTYFLCRLSLWWSNPALTWLLIWTWEGWICPECKQCSETVKHSA